jgi:hypothetical protein
MNYLIVFLGVVIVLLLAYLYYYATTKVVSLTSSVVLNKQQFAFDNSKLKTPGSVHYAYGVWLFINTWGAAGESASPPTTAYNIATTGTTNGTIVQNQPLLTNPTRAPIVIFQRQDSSHLTLYLDSQKPSLYYAIADARGNMQIQLITNNFPIQAWTQIIFSGDNNIIDIYLNGKLILSNIYQQGLAIPNSNASIVQSNGSSGNALQLGNSSVAFDANVASFQQWANFSMDPQTAWSSYLNGNGVLVNTPSYNVIAQFTKDNVVQSKMSIF